MAGRDSGSTEGTGKAGRLKIEGKQRKLMVEGSKKVKLIFQRIREKMTIVRK